MSAREMAERLGLHRAGNDWRGDCPACEYSGSFVLTETREGRPLLWCSSCRDRAALGGLLRGSGHCPPPERTEAAARPSGAQREAWARDQWDRTVDDDGTIRRYLDARGLSGFMPDDVRLLPSLLHRDSGSSWPAMVAAVRDSRGALRAVHRTWLRHDGGGKAPVEPARKTLGNPTGCAVRLYPAADALVLAEGIETTIAASLLFDLPGWACISAGGMEAVVLPDAIRRVLVAADNDMNGVGQRAAKALSERLAAEGRQVRIATPDTAGTDFCDVLRLERPNV